MRRKGFNSVKFPENSPQSKKVMAGTEVEAIHECNLRAYSTLLVQPTFQDNTGHSAQR